MMLRRLLHRLKAFITHRRLSNPPWPAGRMRKSASKGDRARWRRWQQANGRRQRQMSAIKRLGGGKIHPNSTDGSLRVRYGGWDEAKVLRAGESLELVVRSGQVWAYRRGEPLKGPAPDPYKDWDGTAEPGQNVLETLRPAIMRDVPRDRVPVAGGQNDRGAKGE